MRCKTDNFFFKPARTCGGGGEEEEKLPPTDEELERRLSALEMDSVRSHVSDDAMDAILNTTSRLKGGLSRAGFKVGFFCLAELIGTAWVETLWTRNVNLS